MFKKAEKHCKYGVIRRYPGCCDKTGCVCACMYLCQTRKDVLQILLNHAKLNDFENTKCTNKVKSEKQGMRWRDKECGRSTKRKGTKGCHELLVFVH